MTRSAAVVTAPCPAWCQAFHGPASVAPVHTVTVLETGDEVVTLIQSAHRDGSLSPARMWIYAADDRAWSLRADDARPAGELFTTGTDIPKLNELGRAFLVVADLVEASPCPAWCTEAHGPGRPVIHRYEVDSQELHDGGFRTVAIQQAGDEQLVVLAAADRRGTASVDIPSQTAARMAALGAFNGGDRWLSNALKVAAELLGHDVDVPATD